jgi:hypothetical protein
MDENIKKLALSVVIQAVDNWRYLCKHPDKETVSLNFDELTKFFDRDCDLYSMGTSLTGKGILKRLLREKSEAKRKIYTTEPK